MTAIIPLHLAVEDPLSEVVLRELLRQSGRNFAVGQCYQRGGFGFLKKSIRGFNNAAQGIPFAVLTDLDQYPCPTALITEWLPVPKRTNLLFRVAVHEVEAWLLADREAFAKFLGIRRDWIPANPDEILRVKEELIGLARRSRSRELKRDIVPPAGSTRKQGPDYNGRLSGFVQNYWSLERASRNSPSLQRAQEAFLTFKPAGCPSATP
jgi:hypothetical protein